MTEVYHEAKNNYRRGSNRILSNKDFVFERSNSNFEQRALCFQAI